MSILVSQWQQKSKAIFNIQANFSKHMISIIKVKKTILFL